MDETSAAAIRQRKKPIVTLAPDKPPDSSNRSKPSHQSTKPAVHVRLDVALGIFFASHVVAALYHPIQDCDEVFNYWEPTHYLNHGHGFQTWEYSPIYAIRSWTYAGLHALVTSLGVPLASLTASKAAEFYLLRITLGLVCALCETRLFLKIGTTLNPRVAITFLLIMVTSPGMFHASVAYLPSSFAMHTTMLGVAAFMDWRGGLRTAQGIFAMGVGTLIGWPFAAAMAIPFLLEEAVFAAVGDRDSIVSLLQRVIYGAARTLLVLAGQVAVDAFFYKKLLLVPFNIVWYNVFAGKGGPDLYGTEPWHFYLRNLFLNFHVWFLLALLSMPLMLAQHFLQARGATKATYLRGLVFLSPFYFWLAIFTLQPHKEERFMYPAYPALALNAAVALHIILANFGSTNPKDTVSKIPVQLRLATIIAFLLTTIALSIFRTLGTITAYQAPLSIYQPLQTTPSADPDTTLCLGKEWYRFPSHYLLPSNVHAKFIKSEFSGLLPGEFHQGGPSIGLGIFAGTHLTPPGMNDENREDPGKYTDLRRCDYLVDSRLPSTRPTALEPDFLADVGNWERVKCLPFLDAAATGVVGRLGWIPDLPFVPGRLKRVWGEYCLLKRRKRSAGMILDSMPLIETLT